MRQSTDLRDALRVKPGSRVEARVDDPSATFGFDKAAAEPALARQLDRLADLQDRLWAEATPVGARRPPGHRCRRQGRHDQQGHGGVQPAGLPGHVVQGPDARRSSPTTSCGGSTRRSPRKGEIGIFNRSHYEDVLVVRVHDLVPQGGLVEALRPDQRLRARRSPTNGTTIVKFFLSIDRDEQRDALPGALRRPDQALEVLDGRPRGAEAAGTTTRPRSTRR